MLLFTISSAGYLTYTSKLGSFLFGLILSSKDFLLSLTDLEYICEAINSVWPSCHADMKWSFTFSEKLHVANLAIIISLLYLDLLVFYHGVCVLCSFCIKMNCIFFNLWCHSQYFLAKIEFVSFQVFSVSPLAKLLKVSVMCMLCKFGLRSMSKVCLSQPSVILAFLPAHPL